MRRLHFNVILGYVLKLIFAILSTPRFSLAGWVIRGFDHCFFQFSQESWLNGGLTRKKNSCNITAHFLLVELLHSTTLRYHLRFGHVTIMYWTPRTFLGIHSLTVDMSAHMSSYFTFHARESLSCLNKTWTTNVGSLTCQDNHYGAVVHHSMLSVQAL